jgi:hypothetical protein
VPNFGTDAARYCFPCAATIDCALLECLSDRWRNWDLGLERKAVDDHPSRWPDCVLA